MTRNQWLVLTVGSAALVVAIVWMWTTAPGGRPIGELDDVYYSAPEDYADFILNRAPSGTGWVHLPRPRTDPPYQSRVDPTLLGFVRPEVCGECHKEIYESQRLTAH